VLANTRLTVQDGAGTFGLVWDRGSGHLTATLRCAAASTWLVDGDDGWVGNWHAWLASLGYLPMVRWVAVTADTAPEPGTTLQGAVLPRIRAEAPADVQHLLREIVARSPADNCGILTYRGPLVLEPPRGGLTVLGDRAGQRVRHDNPKRLGARRALIPLVGCRLMACP